MAYVSEVSVSLACTAEVLSLLFSSASSRLLSSASAYMPRLYSASFRELPVIWAFRSFDQRLVGQPLAGCAAHEAVEPLCRMPCHIAFIEPESELVNISAKVFLADVMERAIDAAL